MIRPTILLLATLTCVSGQSIEWQKQVRGCFVGPIPTTLKAIVQVESSGNTNALSVNYPERTARHLGFASGRILLAKQPRTLQQANSWIHQLIAHGLTVSIGLMQVNTEDAAQVGLSPVELLDPCTNVNFGWRLFCLKYQIAAQHIGAGRLAVRAALSLYNTGRLWDGFSNGYVAAVASAAGKEHRLSHK